MIKVGNVWHSAFPDSKGTRAPIVKNRGQATVASYKSLTGGHAMMYLEYLDEMGFLVTRKVHLVAGLGGSQRAEAVGSGSSASGFGANEIEILDEEKGVFHPGSKDAPEEDRSDDYYYTAYPMTDAQRASLDAAIRRFIAKNAKGRYTYRIAGGVIGRLTTAPKVRGVNCADFIIKVLDEAGIAHIKSKVFNTPSRVAGH
ncbi:hypothetical protein [Falsiroseomonas oryziterrae]|uniref:hypothetical protein n=1 Tax=Falsiroseomonas oryziterrae TaxID=2911368 RepID=UPI001F2BCE07|nr:hypothetical protein [Roseomonas sp. NPKOSM-4]